jgi:endonuclease G
MALLHYNKATDTYHAVAFWTEHLNVSDKNKNFGDYAISIDELQRRTGIDFFCNLPDAEEVDVEATVDLDFWNLTKKN